MRFAAIVLLLSPAIAGRLPAQSALSSADSALVGRILLAEDRRDSTERALSEGLRHADGRVRTIARRALGRIVDPRFAARDSLPPVAAPRSWPEPAWKTRYRALADRRDDCAALRTALGDPVWPVRFHAASLVGASCASDDAIAAALRAWIDSLPRDVSRRASDGVSWHGAAHGIVALARLRPAEARPRLAPLARHPQWQLRLYAARAAATLADTTLLRALGRDTDDNVKEVAIAALSQLGGHDHDDVYLAALSAEGAQAVRAAAIALNGSTRSGARNALQGAYERWLARSSDSESDVRVALLAALGRPPDEDRPPAQPAALPPDAVALALGADARLRVSMHPASGGGTFVVRLRGDVAPIMSARILELARAGYYDGLSWHRVEHDFVVQGGSPGANEYVGHARYVRDELGTLPHARGTVGMSTRGHDTGDAQWFINLRDNLRLGRNYSVFAEVVEGMDVVDRILEGDVIARIEVCRHGVPGDRACRD